MEGGKKREKEGNGEEGGEGRATNQTFWLRHVGLELIA